MKPRKLPDRKQQIALMDDVQVRLTGHAQKWMERAEYRESLFRPNRSSNQGLERRRLVGERW